MVKGRVSGTNISECITSGASMPIISSLLLSTQRSCHVADACNTLLADPIGVVESSYMPEHVIYRS